MMETKQLLVAIDLYSIFIPYYGSQRLQETVWFPTFF